LPPGGKLSRLDGLLAWRRNGAGLNVAAISAREVNMLIQKLRLQRGWSQEQLADVSGLSVRTIQRLEGGQPGSLESMNALAAVFDVDLDQLKEPSMETLKQAFAPTKRWRSRTCAK
jgi:DNA-binding XRE family transcriptional regulator